MPIAATYNEKDLLAMIAIGDRKAFTQLYTTHLNSLYRYIFLFTKSKEETEEIVQDIFVRIWENRETLNEIDSFRNYIYRCAKNKVLDNVKHLQTRQRILSEIKRTKELSAATTSDQYAYKEYYNVVQQAIDKLPPKRKLIFRLNIEKGLSADEIALELNISKSVVQKQTYKASHFVKEYFSRHGEVSFPIIIAFLFSFF